MSNIPDAYAWLATVKSPPLMVQYALAEYGVLEASGEADNPKILSWAAELGEDIARLYRADSVPWCGLFMALVAKRAGKAVPVHPLWALSWASFGICSPQPALGDVLVFKRDGGGHVALYVGEDDRAFHVLGGNQADRVCFTRIARARLFAARRPLYRVQPAAVRPYRLAAGGGLSVSEA